MYWAVWLARSVSILFFGDVRLQGGPDCSRRDCLQPNPAEHHLILRRRIEPHVLERLSLHPAKVVESLLIERRGPIVAFAGVSLFVFVTFARLRAPSMRWRRISYVPTFAFTTIAMMLR